MIYSAFFIIGIGSVLILGNSSTDGNSYVFMLILVNVVLYKVLCFQISQQKTHMQAYIRTQKRTRSYTEEDLHGIKWPIDRSTNTAANTATASAEASADAPDALVNAPT